MKTLISLSKIAFVLILLLSISCNKNDTSPNVENSSYDNSVSQVKDYLNSNLKDPDSYESIEWGTVEKTTDGYKVWHKYRAKNSFGAKIIENTVFYLDTKGNVVKTVDFEEDIEQNKIKNKSKWHDDFIDKHLKDSSVFSMKINDNILTIILWNTNSDYKKITKEIAIDFWTTFREYAPNEAKSITVVYFKNKLIKEIRVSDRGVIFNEDM